MFFFYYFQANPRSLRNIDRFEGHRKIAGQPDDPAPFMQPCRPAHPQCSRPVRIGPETSGARVGMMVPCLHFRNTAPASASLAAPGCTACRAQSCWKRWTWIRRLAHRPATSRLHGFPPRPTPTAAAVVAFLSRHGAGHGTAPQQINYRANLWALKSLGVQAVISSAAVGGLVASHRTGSFAVPDQFLDRTWGRHDTFYDGTVAAGVQHLPAADPYNAALRGVLIGALKKSGEDFTPTATVAVINGPRFSTRAESAVAGPGRRPHHQHDPVPGAGACRGTEHGVRRAGIHHRLGHRARRLGTRDGGDGAGQAGRRAAADPCGALRSRRRPGASPVRPLVRGGRRHPGGRRHAGQRGGSRHGRRTAPGGPTGEDPGHRRRRVHRRPHR